MIVRFRAADFSGENVIHCKLLSDLYGTVTSLVGHFLRHEDLGMMDSFLITPEHGYRVESNTAQKGPTFATHLFTQHALSILGSFVAFVGVLGRLCSFFFFT